MTDIELMAAIENLNSENIKPIFRELAARVGAKPDPAPAQPPEDKARSDAIALAELWDMGVLARKACREMGVKNAYELSQKAVHEVLAVRNCGQTTLSRMRKFLAKRGMTLRGDIEGAKMIETRRLT